MEQYAPPYPGAKEGARADTREDAALYALACRGDEDAVALLMDRYREPLSAFIHTVLSDPRDVEEIVIDAFAGLVASSGRFRGASSLKTYLFAIARHLAGKRRAAGWYAIPVGFLPLHPDSPGCGLNDWLEDSALDAAALRDSLGHLPKEIRQAITLACLQGMSHQEVSEVLGKSVRHVHYLIGRGKKLLRQMLDPPPAPGKKGS